MKFPRKDLDETDLAILELLQTDGRLSLSELGRRIGMSAMAVSDRIDRMADMQVIEGFTVVINKERIGLPLHAFIVADRITPEKRRELDRIIQEMPQISAAYRVMSGGKEVILNVYCRSASQLIELQNRLSRLITYSTFLVEPQGLKKNIPTEELLD